MHIYIDEAGRGPLAGPVSVGLIFCPSKSHTKKIFRSYKDSKKLSAKKRDMLFTQLQHTDIVWSYAKSSAAYIDKNGIIAAIREAITKGIQKIIPDYKQQSMTLHIDGNTDFGLQKKFPGITVHTYIKGDDRVPPISAASIVAKVLRDRELIRLDKKFPQYRFARHKGYGTQYHRDMIQKYGLSRLHRKSFCRNIDIL